MTWWAWLLVDLALLVAAAAVTTRVAWRTWRRFRVTLRSVTALDLPAVDRPVHR